MNAIIFLTRRKEKEMLIAVKQKLKMWARGKFQDTETCSKSGCPSRIWERPKGTP